MRTAERQRRIVRLDGGGIALIFVILLREPRRDDVLLEQAVHGHARVHIGGHDIEESALYVALMRAQIGEMDIGAVARPLWIDFAAVEGLPSQPGERIQAVAALHGEGHENALAAGGAAAALMHDGVSGADARVKIAGVLRRDIGAVVIGRAAEYNGKPPGIIGERAARIQTRSVAHGRHVFLKNHGHSLSPFILLSVSIAHTPKSVKCENGWVLFELGTITVFEKMKNKNKINFKK